MINFQIVFFFFHKATSQENVVSYQKICRGHQDLKHVYRAFWVTQQVKGKKLYINITMKY